LSEPQSGERFRPAHHSQSTDSRARVLAALDATNQRLARIADTNAAASAALSTACESGRGVFPFYLYATNNCEREGSWRIVTKNASGRSST
jgi:hypothetical protein